MKDTTQQWLNFAETDLRTCNKILGDGFLTNTIYATSRYPGDFGLIPEGKPSQELAEQLYIFAKYIFGKTTEMIGR